MFLCIVVRRGLAGAAVTVVLTTAIIVGCGDPGPTDAENVMTAISDLPDAARDVEAFQSLFVGGAVPADVERLDYTKYIFNMDEPTVIEETAKVTVHVTNAEGDVLGTMEWVLSLDNGKWKIRSAPLP